MRCGKFQNSEQVPVAPTHPSSSHPHWNSPSFPRFMLFLKYIARPFPGEPWVPCSHVWAVLARRAVCFKARSPSRGSESPVSEIDPLGSRDVQGVERRLSSRPCQSGGSRADRTKLGLEPTPPGSWCLSLGCEQLYPVMYFILVTGLLGSFVTHLGGDSSSRDSKC